MAAEPSFVAIDFETANQSPTSACSVGLVTVRRGRVIAAESRLIRPPTRHFSFTEIHGLAWPDVADAPTFGEHWPWMRERLSGIDFIAAHNASFDRRVLETCCAFADAPDPAALWLCTVKLARKTWGHRYNRLDLVASRLGLTLNHHDALSDARACAGIVLAAVREGADVGGE